MKLKYVLKLILNNLQKKTTLFFILVVAKLTAVVKQINKTNLTPLYTENYNSLNRAETVSPRKGGTPMLV